ncbi:MAG: UDP-N-acetylmuramoyl-L-alanyl-D-glutamate--2,6-diaminopimelate ligase [Actinobacteria bacterium]|nr:UDP-N-acetylmuramoyl-L-alanyl-D-glutamate--2,6-diaminopimelate ligase [Actinomycetota bacterium]
MPASSTRVGYVPVVAVADHGRRGKQWAGKAAMAMLLSAFLDGVRPVDMIGEVSTVHISSVSYDSREVRDGALFCCLDGTRYDGHEFAGLAVSNGASALLVERRLDIAVPQIVVTQGAARAAMAVIAANFYGRPSGSLVMFGVTGTNGKTTVAHMVASILRAGGLRTSVIGTLGGGRTTPESADLQRSLAQARDSGFKAVSMEVSSHGMVQHRVDAIRFQAAVFTNLSPEHLDYHKTMDMYFAAKAALFVPERVENAIINVDDPWGRLLVERASGVPVLRYSADEASEVSQDEHGSSFCWRGMQVRIPLAGRYNVLNAIAAANAGLVLGVDEDEIAEGLYTMEPVPGRFALYRSPSGGIVVIDYAHTPDALEAVLMSAREIMHEPSRQLTCVFGCGGDRDASKRPLMGSVAARLADRVVVTSDNSRNENPVVIMDEIVSGIGADDRNRLVVEIDRRKAIKSAVAQLRDGDVVVVAGRGHETVMEAGGKCMHFSDAEVVTGCMAVPVGRYVSVPGGSLSGGEGRSSGVGTDLEVGTDPGAGVSGRSTEGGAGTAGGVTCSD